MLTVKKAVSGSPWWCLYYNDILLETFDRRWQAERAKNLYELENMRLVR